MLSDIFSIVGGAASKFTYIVSCRFDLNFSSSLIINEIISSKFLSAMYDICIAILYSLSLSNYLISLVCCLVSFSVSHTVYQMNLLSFLHYTPQRDYGVSVDGFRNPLTFNHN